MFTSTIIKLLERQSVKLYTENFIRQLLKSDFPPKIAPSIFISVAPELF